MKLSTSKSVGNILSLHKRSDDTTKISVLRKSCSTSNCVIVNKRGFKPSDLFDPHKRQFLTSLTSKLWHVSLDETSHTTNDGLSHRPIDLEKIFTPASDSGELTPSRNRKMYSSSSFYSSNLHPTLEDQVELARKISHSLSDATNQQSKGQSMYVNRKKRSVKWVHEGPADGGKNQENETGSETPGEKLLSFKIPNIGPQEMKFNDGGKPALKLVMDPRGQIQDISSLRRQGYNIEPGAVSPEVCFDLVRDLNAPKGKGAELFAKRRKKSEKWVVDENTLKQVTSSSMMTTEMMSSSTSIFQHQTSTSSNLSKQPPIPSYLDKSIQRAEHTQKLNQIQERFNQPRLRMVKSPWEAALETGSVDTAFQENPPVLVPREFQETPVFPEFLIAPTLSAMEPNIQQRSASPTPAQTWMATATSSSTSSLNAATNYSSTQVSCQRVAGLSKEFLYKPKAPTGWNTQQQQQEQQMFDPSPAATYNYETPMQMQPEASLPPVASTATGPNKHNMMYAELNNYNTAPRGWGQGLDYYRPVTFQPTKVVVR